VDRSSNGPINKRSAELVFPFPYVLRSGSAGLQVADGLAERDLREPMDGPRHALRPGTEPRHALAGFRPQVGRPGPRAPQHVPEPVSGNAGKNATAVVGAQRASARGRLGFPDLRLANPILRLK
jgi:hypothetical protein